MLWRCVWMWRHIAPDHRTQLYFLRWHRRNELSFHFVGKSFVRFFHSFSLPFSLSLAFRSCALAWHNSTVFSTATALTIIYWFLCVLNTAHNCCASVSDSADDYYCLPSPQSLLPRCSRFFSRCDSELFVDTWIMIKIYFVNSAYTQSRTAVVRSQSCSYVLGQFIFDEEKHVDWWCRTFCIHQQFVDCSHSRSYTDSRRQSETANDGIEHSNTGLRRSHTHDTQASDNFIFIVWVSCCECMWCAYVDLVLFFPFSTSRLSLSRLWRQANDRSFAKNSTTHRPYSVTHTLAKYII